MKDLDEDKIMLVAAGIVLGLAAVVLFSLVLGVLMQIHPF